MTIWRIWQQSWASLCLIISENFGVWYFWESLSLIFIGIFDFDIFENIWVWYFWDAKWLQVWNWWRGFFVAPAWSTKSWIAPNVGYQNLWEFAKSKTLPLQTNFSRNRNLVKLIFLWKGVMQQLLVNEFKRPSMQCSVSSYWKWLWEMNRFHDCHCAFYGTKNVNGSVNVLVLVFSYSDQSELVEYLFF